MNQDKEILSEESPPLAMLTLNRPQALNALSYNMIVEITAVLERWRQDDRIKTVLMRGAGDRAFCAGGDIKMAYHAGLAFKKDISAPAPATFFREEYRLNKILFHYPKPIISFMDGITMGGGYGIGGNCRYRIVTDRTVFAMPETGIGFFPDVGIGYHLARAKGRSGFYLALTGNSVSGLDMVHAGLAEYYMTHDQEAALIDALKRDDPKTVLEKLKVPTRQKGFLEMHEQEIDSVFASNDPETILHNFGGSHLCEVIPKRSPTSVKVSARHVAEAAGKSFDDSIAQDFILAHHFLAGHDMFEGIRAALIDKDKNPRWTPSRLEEVSKADVEAYFTDQGFESL